MNVLGTTPARTSWTQAPGSLQVVHELHFLDFTIDGVPLRELPTARTTPPNPVQEMTVLCEDQPWPGLAVSGLRQLLGEEPGEFTDGRVALLVCPIDADLGCGAYSTALIISDASVEWRDIGWQTHYEPGDPTAGAARTWTFRFERAAYTRLLREALAHFQHLAADDSHPHSP